jgi:hypothetical protein
LNNGYEINQTIKKVIHVLGFFQTRRYYSFILRYLDPVNRQPVQGFDQIWMGHERTIGGDHLGRANLGSRFGPQNMNTNGLFLVFSRRFNDHFKFQHKPKPMLEVF